MFDAVCGVLLGLDRISNESHAAKLLIECAEEFTNHNKDSPHYLVDLVNQDAFMFWDWRPLLLAISHDMEIETSTQEGSGTTFKLVLPLTTAVTQVVMLRVGNFTVGVPSNLVETVLRTPVAVLEQAYARDAFEINGQTIPFFWAGALLQVSAQSHEAVGKTRSVAVFRSAGQRLAMHVDEILGNREVVEKNLGPQLAQLPGRAGGKRCSAC